jgi:predicted nuclease of restriction endonuclease-like (RecB) superfamily
LPKRFLQAHEHLAARASKAVNVSLTLRNWVICWYIYEYEQNGADRADYGANLHKALSERLANQGIQSAATRTLRLYRKFYLTYPQIRQSLIAESSWDIETNPIWQSLIAKSDEGPNPADLEVDYPGIQPSQQQLLERLSFTHLAELIAVDNPLKRAFYEIECMRGNWSVRELKRQIASLYYERSGLSKDKERLAELAQSGAQQAEPKLAIRDPYVFEFLEIKPKEVMAESDLEASLLDKLQEFLLELGHGFCLEAGQKRILIGDEYFFVDLVFYHRILKCHVLIELKIDEFTHEYLGQLNTYVSWFKRNEMAEDDNPPIGILLCTRKNHALVEFAVADMDNQLFVSRYQTELPAKDEIERFLEGELKEREALKDEE